jgi:hypothetical protein
LRCVVGRRCSGDASRRVFPVGCTPKPAVDNGVAIAIGKLVISGSAGFAGGAHRAITGDRTCRDRQLDQPVRCDTAITAERKRGYGDRHRHVVKIGLGGAQSIAVQSSAA